MWSLDMDTRRMLSLGSSLWSWRLLRNRQVTKAGVKACNEHPVQGNCDDSSCSLCLSRKVLDGVIFISHSKGPMRVWPKRQEES